MLKRQTVQVVEDDPRLANSLATVPGETALSLVSQNLKDISESNLCRSWVSVVVMKILHNCTSIPSVDAASLAKNWQILLGNTRSFRRAGVE